MQKKYILRDRCTLLFALLIFSTGTCSLFGNTRGVNLFDLATYQHRIKGTVTDSGGIPIQGVNVGIKGSSSGTFSDEKGTFYLEAAPSDVLILSYIGFKKLEVAVGSSKELSLVLEEDVMDLGAVTVNAGYYTVSEKERTGNIAKVTSKEIELQPIVSPLQSLEGRMAGVEVEQGSGINGLAPTIRIRGQNSLRNSRSNNGNYPLYIVDGIPISSTPISSIGSMTSGSGIDPLSTLNLKNIESIEVLKDADATAIYGSRGANGVVLITTKRGNRNQDETIFSVDFYSGISNVSNKVSLLNTQEYIAVKKRAFENDGVEPTESNAPYLFLYDQNRYTDWQDVLLGKTATTSNINMSVSGGNENTSYLVGGSYLKQGSVFPGDFDYNKITLNFNLNHLSSNGKFRLDFSANYGIDDNRIFMGGDFINKALRTPPNSPAIYNDDGSLNWEDWITDNPLAELNRPQDIETYNLFANLSMSYEIINGLRLKVNSGFSKLDSNELIRTFKDYFNPDIWYRVNLYSLKGNTSRQSWIVEPQLTYNKKIGGLYLDGLVGSTFQKSNSHYFAIQGSGYINESLMKNIEAADQVSVLNDDNLEYRYAAIFGRIGINWKKKYFFNITGRRDGSSRFGPRNRFSNFWALGGAWIFSEENIFKQHLPFISFGKFRGSYGTTGNDQIPDYGFMDTYEPTVGAGGLYPTQLFNADYSWEVNKKLEVALQLGFLKDHLNLEVSWYRNRSSNQLVGYPLSATTGFASVQANLPATVQNTGLEIQFTSTNVQNKNFSWKTSLNATFPDNKLLRFDTIEESSYANNYRVGEPLNISLLYAYDGIDPETGFYNVLDANEDGRYDNDDRVVIKNMGRKYYGGVSNQIAYKGLSFQFLFEYVKQSNTNFLLRTAPMGINNLPKEYLSSWEQPGDVEPQKLSESIDAIYGHVYAGSSSLNVTDASFLRLKNVSLSYRFPQELYKKLGIESGMIYINAQNLLTITDYLGPDPQGGASVVPPLRTITCGIQVNL
ncbi:SusC/RagA family TonB-linked outer membrane protein [Galbibacter sp. PAP.153]|uniref:SusC/RagA family TonB-linked outer membrane protein n=1 Tax=Galbibacter sp. PAP.153 TaxID=3104623 RepID=UPI00300B62E0